VAEFVPAPWLKDIAEGLSYIVTVGLGGLGGWLAKQRQASSQAVPSIAPPIVTRDAVAAQVEDLHKAVLQPHPEFERNMPEQVRQLLRYVSFIDRYGNRVSLLGQVLESLTQAVHSQSQTSQAQTLILERLESLMEERLEHPEKSRARQAEARRKEGSDGRP
jgi:3-methyladenine DNA glycosylase/8-oxoguanine DNA glycosylase